MTTDRYATLRAAAEAATPHPAETRSERLHRFHLAANPAAILALLDERDHTWAAYKEASKARNRAEQRVAALEEGLRMMVEVFADGSGVHSAAAAYCTLSDEGHASIAKARALLSEGER